MELSRIVSVAELFSNLRVMSTSIVQFVSLLTQYWQLVSSVDQGTGRAVSLPGLIIVLSLVHCVRTVTANETL